MTNEKEFAERLSRLRSLSGVSARFMSLDIGQNDSYITQIENGRAMPSMSMFFKICDYLEITPRDFFDFSISNPAKSNLLYEICSCLSDTEKEHLLLVAQDLLNKSSRNN